MISGELSVGVSCAQQAEECIPVQREKDKGKRERDSQLLIVRLSPFEGVFFPSQPL